jgi:hypothetical protein
MKSLQITLDGTFRSKTEKTKGQIRYRYSVKGTEENLEAYREAQGEYYAETEDGVPLFFTSQFLGKRSKIQITDKGQIVSGSTELDMLNSLAMQYPALAGTDAGMKMLRDMLGSMGTDSDNEPVINKTETEEESLDDLIPEQPADQGA